MNDIFMIFCSVQFYMFGKLGVSVLQITTTKCRFSGNRRGADSSLGRQPGGVEEEAGHISPGDDAARCFLQGKSRN